MKQVIILLVLSAGLLSCDKSEVAQQAVALPVTSIITKGNWVMTYTESGSEVDVGMCLAAFTSNGKYTVIKNGTNLSGTWSEVKNNDGHTLKLNVVSDEANLLKTNGSWRVIVVTATHIDITDPDLAKRHTVHFTQY